MVKPHAGSTLAGVMVYLGIALLLHLPIFADNFSLNAGREALIADTALSSNTLLIQVGGYFLAVITLNMLPLIPIVLCFRSQFNLIQKFGLSTTTYFAITSLCFWIAILSLNARYYPRSAFSILLPFRDNQQTQTIGLIALSLFTVICILPAIWTSIRVLARLTTKPIFQATIVGSLVAVAILPENPRATEQAEVRNKPDIIIIGMDSVSPLHLNHHIDKVPRLKNLLQNSSLFTNTITPLARTFPAWTTILTGNYPINHGARFNLTRFDQVETSHTLARILQEHGYQTVYAQDERKFNNLDESFGFDITVGPKPGAAEFVLTNISDHPLANLALLLPGSAKLFPFIKFNRADDIHYEPTDFVDEILNNLPQSTSKPLFLATHFCLVHYPYTWRTQGKADKNGLPSDTETQHLRALEALEYQITQLIDGLKAVGRMDNTILVVLSDHGESLAYSDGLWPIASTNPQEFNVSKTPFNPVSSYSGHGSNVTDRTQYNALLAFTAYGQKRSHFPSSTSNELASLADIMPTVLYAAGISVPANIDGINLMAPMLHTGTDTRTVPAETGITFSSLASIAALNEDEVLKEAQKYYAIDDESARLFVKPEYYQDLIYRKDIAIHSKDWLLAFLRQDLNVDHERITLLVHKPTGKWTLGKNDELIAQAPISLLAGSAKKLYATEITDFQNSWAFR